VTCPFTIAIIELELSAFVFFSFLSLLYSFENINTKVRLKRNEEMEEKITQNGEDSNSKLNNEFSLPANNSFNM
jgi:hypothetical protein